MKRLIILFTLILTALGINAQKERKMIREGNSEYDNKKYLEAEIEYRKAIEKKNDSFEAQFNLGDALFKQEKYDNAAEQFEILAETNKDKDKKDLAKVYHNLGNSYFALKKYEKSIDAYKQSLRLNPDDNQTRYNLIAAMKMLKQQQQQKQNKDKNKDKNKDQNKQDQKKQQQQQNKDQQQKEQQQQNKDQQQKQQQQQQQQMSQKDAQRLLNAIQQDENELQKKLRKVKASKKTKSGKNW